MDIVLKLRECRRAAGLSQVDVAELSGLGEKTISSFESGSRIAAMKVSQLAKLLRVYGISEAEFFGVGVERVHAPHEIDEIELRVIEIAEKMRRFPRGVQKILLDQFELIMSTARAISRQTN